MSTGISGRSESYRCSLRGWFSERPICDPPVQGLGEEGLCVMTALGRLTRPKETGCRSAVADGVTARSGWRMQLPQPGPTGRFLCME